MNPYGIKVKFFDRGVWSKPYTYLHHSYIEKGTPVIVQNGLFYSVGEVVESIENYEQKSGIVYKKIFKVGL